MLTEKNFMGGKTSVTLVCFVFLRFAPPCVTLGAFGISACWDLVSHANARHDRSSIFDGLE